MFINHYHAKLKQNLSYLVPMLVFTNNTFKIPEVMSKVPYIYLLLTDVILKKYMMRKD